MRLRALAKINLGLDILRKREDGYHEVKMIMQTIRMYDILDIAKTMSQLQKQCSAEEIEAFYHVISVYNEVIKKDFEINKSPRKRTDVTPLP